jgi:hypothetical protein
LTSFEDCADHLDWEVRKTREQQFSFPYSQLSPRFLSLSLFVFSQIGQHGIVIDFTDPSGKHRHATYLPEVASDQGWDKLETLHSLIKKAGYVGKINDGLLRSLKVTRYQSSKQSIHYSRYQQIKAVA